MFSSQRLIVVVAAIGLVATSACSRSSGGSNPQPIQNPPAQSTLPNSQSELDGKSGTSAQENKGPQNSGSTDDSKDGSNSGGKTAPAANRPVNRPVTTAPRPDVSNAHDPSEDGPQVINYDPTGMTPSQIFAASQKQGTPAIGLEANIANGQSADPVYFSGAGQDDLHAQIQAIVDTKTKPARVQRDKDFAKTVSNGYFDVDWNTRNVTLTVVLKKNGQLVPYQFSGSLDNRLLFRAGDLRHGQNVAVEAACMDLNGGCNTVYAKVQDATGGTVRTAHMLIRQTEATLFTQADGFGVAQNEEFDTLLRTLVRTDHHAGERDALNKLRLRTSETINGQSSFAVEMGVRSMDDRQESINFAGPLVKPSDDISLTVQAQLLPSTDPAAETIRSVSLVNNDGRGTITLAVTVRKATADAQEDTMNLTIARIHKPVRTLIIN